MMLRALCEYAQRDAETQTAPRLYAEGPVRYRIDLDPQGRYIHGPVDLSDKSSARAKAGLRRLLPQVQRGYNIRPLLLADNAAYLLGYDGDDPPSRRTQDSHAAFVELVERCADISGSSEVQATLAFLLNRPLEQVELPEDFDPKGVIAFSVSGQFVVDLPEVKKFWADINRPDSAERQCMVCLNYEPTLDRLQSKIKGIPGGQTSGTSLISANSKAFESYGLEASQVAPICADCAEGFTRGLNSLLANERSRFATGSNVSVFWTKGKIDFDPFELMTNPDEAQVKALFRSAWTGRPNDVDDMAFYALTLSGSGGRAVVRDWLDTTVPKVRQNALEWFKRQRIAPVRDDNASYYGLRALAYSTVREPKDLPATTPRLLFNAFLTGAPLPNGILQSALMRNAAERRVTRPRAALIKLALLSEYTQLPREDYMVNLENGNADPGYLCGQLFGVLENAQHAALGNVNASIADRHYGTASASPQLVFPQLLRGVRAHLSKLQRDKKGAAVTIEKSIQDILSNLDEFPKRLDARQQGLFALGYYHNRAVQHQRIQDAKERREQAQDAGESTVDADD